MKAVWDSARQVKETKPYLVSSFTHKNSDLFCFDTCYVGKIYPMHLKFGVDFLKFCFFTSL